MPMPVLQDVDHVEICAPHELTQLDLMVCEAIEGGERELINVPQRRSRDSNSIQQEITDHGMLLENHAEQHPIWTRDHNFTRGRTDFDGSQSKDVRVTPVTTKHPSSVGRN